MTLGQLQEVAMHALSRALRLFSTLGRSWRTVGILFVLANLKNLPLVWHLRFFNGLFTHFYLHPSRLTPKTGPRAIFQPIITTSRSPLLECDYNVHKSNSTYFSDLDVSRTHLIAALMKGGLDSYRERMKKEKGGGKFLIALGAVSCVFRREIAPYEEYEIWSRVLSWDRKWMYIVSHFVRKGAVRPKGYTLQPGRDPKEGRAWWFWRREGVVKEPAEGSRDSSGTSSPSLTTEQQQHLPHGAIFASAISKYVFKQGRLTTPPELVLERSGILPPRPTSSQSPPSSLLGESTVDLAAANDLLSKDEAIIDASLTLEDEDGEWDWARVEKEREKGMLVAEKLVALDLLHSTFTGEEEMALGAF
ncbi:hypothetical protein FGG08_006673 [Glutinoglossum americanum]|uniref:Capsule polysaccharide biosynthesis protein n=1 Tax=Glutinoglossum americanum TaxID=1670608 RepID=A0A9P8HXU5_9PEZI|nr:hypothetical protein FGG08_006673 [Glutinoglossum americanum]